MNTKKVFGDFQTPLRLAEALCQVLAREIPAPSQIVEPTCGSGSFLQAAANAWPAARLVGREISERYVLEARKRVPRANVDVADFFDVEWRDFAAAGTLFVGNPPWVTSANLGRNDAGNGPARGNLKGLTGLDSITGKSNFDISEWMLLRLLDACQATGGAVAMICKSNVARKVLEFAGKNQLDFVGHGLWRVDALAEFGASVDAGFFAFSCKEGQRKYTVPVYEPGDLEPKAVWEYVDGIVVSNGPVFRHNQRLIHGGNSGTWRSGVKHDCASVLELQPAAAGWRNQAGDAVDIEPDLVYPFLKSSDLFHGRAPHRSVLLPQTEVGQETRWIREDLPKTWSYLRHHADKFTARRSRIYWGKPEFSIFGIGPYSFSPWKVAVSGLHKEARFRLVEPRDGKPVMLDDTCYFLSFPAKEPALAALDFLDMDATRSTLGSMVFLDNMRPYTRAVLNRLRLPA